MFIPEMPFHFLSVQQTSTHSSRPSYHLWGPLVTSSGRIKYIILCALRAGTIFFCGTLHILLHVIIAIMIIGDCWKLYLHARHCAKCLRCITSLNPQPFPLRCPHDTDEETDPCSNPQLPGSGVCALNCHYVACEPPSGETETGLYPPLSI